MFTTTEILIMEVVAFQERKIGMNWPHLHVIPGKSNRSGSYEAFSAKTFSLNVFPRTLNAMNLDG